MVCCHPSRQLRWSELGFYNFLHFTVNTFTDKEWGEGDEDPAIFNPTAFNADTICAVLKDGGQPRRDSYLQTSRWLLPLAHENHGAFHPQQSI